MAAADYVIVGSGINALVAAAQLGRKGHKVLVLERGDRIGGCIRTEEITAPGFVHDVMATTFVLFITSPAFAELGPELEKRGLSFAHTPTPTAVLLPDGRHAILTMDRKANIAAFDQFAPGDGARFAADVDRVGANAPFLFSLLGGSLWSRAMLKIIAREAWRQGLRGLVAFFGEALGTARGWLETRFQSEVVRALFAPWVLHTGLGPESAYSGEMAKVIAFALEVAGAPIVKGGAQNALTAFERLVRDNGGDIVAGADVERVLVDANGAANGVRLAGGREIDAAKGVICSVTPNQLYRRLLADVALPASVGDAVAHYRYGKGNMQVHYALKTPPQWKAPALGSVALTHLTPGLDGVSKAANEAERGMLPVVPTICVGQPAALDPSRRPPGASILWLQLPEAPRLIKGDAAGQIAVPADGRWTEAVREKYADRIEAILASHIENFRDNVIARRSYSPADLEALNVNLVGGDPYGGFCGIDQFFLWRPFHGSVNHRTPVARLHHIGASTHPGPGLSGGSGYLVAKELG
jgi:phytoene dehydrogenase-like protein